MKKDFLILLIAFSPFLFYSCYYDNPPELPPPKNVSFQNDIQPIFDQSCISCHNGSLVPDLTASNSYNSLFSNNLVIPRDADGSELYKRFIGVGPLMPPGSSLPQSKIDLIEQWINQGALDN